jgi:uncharacterized membrane protein YozB (DUF420 family)
MDITNISLMTKEQVVTMCNANTTIPALAILFISFVVFFLIFGLSLVKKSRGKILLILFLTIVASGLVFLFLYLNPLLVQSFLDWLKSLMQ